MHFHTILFFKMIFFYYISIFMFINIFIEMYQKEDLGQALVLPLKLIAKPIGVMAEEVQKALNID